MREASGLQILMTCSRVSLGDVSFNLRMCLFCRADEACVVHRPATRNPTRTDDDE